MGVWKATRCSVKCVGRATEIWVKLMWLKRDCVEEEDEVGFNFFSAASAACFCSRIVLEKSPTDP